MKVTEAIEAIEQLQKILQEYGDLDVEFTDTDQGGTMPPNNVHPNLNSAKEACRLYLEAVYELQDKFHVFETCDDSCVQTYVSARYLNEEGVIKEYTHW
jgi:hypothetical protein